MLCKKPALLSLALTLITLGTLNGCAMVEEAKALKAESELVVEDMLYDIDSSCNVETFHDLSSPELLTILSDNQIEGLCYSIQAKLGPLESIDEIEGEATIDMGLEGKKHLAEYDVSTTFEQGEASIQMKLIERQGEWQLLAFHLNSDVFN